MDRPIDVLGFSMGGIVGRYYTQRLDHRKRVRHLITVGSPHRGTWTAHLLPRNGARQMRPGSRFLRELNHDVHDLGHVTLSSIWTPFDLMIVPAGSSKLPGSAIHRVDVLAHARMMRDPRVLALVEKLLLG
jgi:triacylglycerol lipase